MRQETIDRIRKFTADRNWDQFHTPANLAKSIAIEARQLRFGTGEDSFLLKYKQNHYIIT